MSERSDVEPGVDPGKVSDDLRMTLDGAGIGTWSLNPVTGEIVLSATCAQLLGVADGQRHTFDSTQATVHPSDRDTRADVIRRALGQGGHYEVDYRVIRSSGETCWLRARGQVRSDADGRPVELRGVIFSIDEQKKAEEDLRAQQEHLRSILETVPEAMIVIDERGIMQSFSAAAEQLFGYRAEDMVGQNVSMLMPAPDRQRHDGYLEHYLATGERKIIGIGRIVTGRRHDGSHFPMELTVGEMRSGERVFFTGFINDLTERQQTQARLQELQAELVHVSRLTAMGEMASALAHELNQPLAAISNYLKGSRRLLDQAEPEALPRVKEALSKAADQAVRAGQIIRRLREFVSRGDTERHPESVSRLIDEASALALVGAREHSVTTRFDLDPDAQRIMADRVQIQQVLVNLLRNALDAMQDSTHRELTVSSRAAGGQVEITVADTGSGIAPEIADKLFQPFMTTKANGMGVGLSISRTIVEAHGGRLWAEPNPQGGASFRLTLPAVEQNQDQRGDVE